MTTRIYQAIKLTLHQEIALDQNASHHLNRVLRKKIGEKIIVFNGNGGEFCASIVSISKNTVVIKADEFNSREAESPVHITLAQGIARGEKMDFVLQKAVELGVHAIIPLLTERCGVQLDHERQEKRMQHWQGVINSACEQSGRNFLPKLHPLQSLTNCLENADAELKFILSPHCAPAKLTPPSCKSIILLVGPEGGFSAQEIQLAEKQQFHALKLGPRILRTETAALAAISALQYRFGDLLL